MRIYSKRRCRASEHSVTIQRRFEFEPLVDLKYRMTATVFTHTKGIFYYILLIIQVNFSIYTLALNEMI